jgi:hypothetical protein
LSAPTMDRIRILSKIKRTMAKVRASTDLARAKRIP